MRRIILFVLCLVCINLGYAQKAKVKDHKVKAKHHLLPTTGFDPSITVYSVDLSADKNALQRLEYTETGIQNAINISGYNQIKEPIGARVYLTLEGPSGSPLKLITKDKKSKDGKTWKEYHYNVVFSASMNVKVTDESGTTLFEQVVPYKETQSSSVYRSSSQLKKGFDTSKFYIGHRRTALSALIKSANSTINEQFGFRPYSKRAHYRKLTSKKHPDYNQWKKYEEEIKLASESLVAQDNSMFIEKAQAAIDFWKEKEPTYSAKDKEQKKLKFACLMNLAQAHLYADKFEEAAAYAQQIIDTKIDEKEGKKMLEEIILVTDGLKNLGRDKRYFKIEVSKEIAQAQEAHKAKIAAAIASGDILAYPDFDAKLRVKSNSIIVKGHSYSISGTETQGYFVYENEIRSGTPDFREPNKIRFGYDDGGVVKMGTPNYSKLDSFLIDTIMYRIEDVTLGSGLTKLKLDNAIIETITEYDKTSLVYVIPPFLNGRSFGQTNETEAELAIYHKAKEEYFPTKVLIGGIDKALKKVVEDCPAALEFIEGVQGERKKKSFLSRLGGFENGDVIVETLELYDGCK